MKQIILILLATLCVSLLAAVNAIHVMPTSYLPGLDLELRVEITQGANTLKAVNLQYRAAGESKWLDSSMREENPGFWLGSIPRNTYSTSEVEYRFEFELLDGKKEYLPAETSLSEAYVIAPKATQGTKSDAFVRLNEESSITNDEDYLLVVSFLAIADELDPATLKVFVSDRDVTELTQISGSTLLYREAKPRPGIKKALVTAVANGRELYSETWITQINPGKAKLELPFTYRGSVNLSANSYSSTDSDISFGNTLSDFATWADIYASYGILDLSTRLYISSLEESNKQPVNRYTFGVQIPYLDLFFGDYSPELSEYTLNGKNIRGLYSKFDSKYLRLTWAHGEAVRKTTVEGNAELTMPYNSGTFKQEAIGARIAIGMEDGFTLGFSGSRHRDIISSLDPDYYRYIDANGDEQYSTKARDNAVMAVDVKLNVPDQHVMMGVELAASMLNTNTLTGVISDEELSDYGINLDLSPSDLADLFVINKNLEPFGLTEANLAWKAFIRSYIMNNMITMEYQQTGPAFNSFGSFYQMNDSKMFTISDHIAFGRILYLSGSFSQTEDNLMGHQTDTNKYRNIQASAILRYPHLPYLKATYYNNSSENSENTDIESDAFLPYSGSSSMMSFGIGYNFIQIPHVPTQIDLSYRSGDDSRESGSIDSRALEIVSDNKNSGLSFSMTNRFLPVPLKTYFAYSSGKNTDNQLEQDYTNSRIYLRVEYSFLAEMLKPYLSFSSTSLGGDQDEQSYTQTALGLQAYPLRNLSISTDLSLKGHSNKDISDKDYNTTTWRLLISQRF